MYKRKSNYERVKEVMEEQELSGDVYQEEMDIIRRTRAAYPAMPVAAIRQALAELSANAEVIRNGTTYGITATVHAERQLGRMLAGYVRSPRIRSPDDLPAKLVEVETDLQVSLSPSQRAAVLGAVGCRLGIITGGPGAGKTTVLKALCSLYEATHKGKEVMLMAPTGRAAHRMSQQTGRKAATIHSAIYTGIGMAAYEPGELAPGLVVVDEASMLHIQLAADLLRALDPATQVIMVGDTYQLPPVGPGQVLADAIECGLPVYQLTDNFRQQSGSLLANNLEHVRYGDNQLIYGDDLRLMETSSDADTEALTAAIYSAMLQEGRDVQILSPIGKAGGVCSCKELNRTLRDWCNPAAPEKLEVTIGNRIYRVGDRIVQLRNTPQARNGDSGMVVRIIGDDTPRIGIHFDGEDNAVYYDIDQVEQDELLDHSYAVTVHKSQGSEYDWVVIPLAQAHVRSWCTNMVYTAMTRAKEGVVLIGNKEVLQGAINSPCPPRATKLQAEIRHHLDLAAQL